MGEPVCRSCRGRTGAQVLDLGQQPAADYFPLLDDPGPDDVYPLQMWLCASCGLAQLVVDPTVPEEARGTEPAALVAQAADAVERVAGAGLLPAGSRIAEYGSPHGGSWLELLDARGLIRAGADEQADVVLDCFGLMHAADQSAALAERVARVAPGGFLLVQYHSLDTIVRLGQWSALRHGHYAYYSTTALTRMLAAQEFAPQSAWRFELYGGTVLLAATRADGRDGPDRIVKALLEEEARAGVTNGAVVTRLQQQAEEHGARVRAWLAAERSAGKKVLGYGAASRAVALLVRAGVDRALLEAVVDSSHAKQGRRMPGTDIPILGTSHLTEGSPDAVLVFVPDLVPEVRAAFPEVEESGGRWVNVEALGG